MNEEYLIELGKRTADLSEKIKSYAKSLTFETVEEFRLEENMQKMPLSDVGKHGVYFFEIKTAGRGTFDDWQKDFREKWGNDIAYSPRIIEKRIDNYKGKPLNEWVPLYIGKRDNVTKRIHQHIELKKDSKTYALKLNSRKGVYGEIFRVKALQFDIDKTVYDIIMPIIEHELREKYYPIIGKQ